MTMCYARSPAQEIIHQPDQKAMQWIKHVSKGVFFIYVGQDDTFCPEVRFCRCGMEQADTDDTNQYCSHFFISLCPFLLYYVRTVCLLPSAQTNGMRVIRLHDLRHSCASLLLANGVPMKQIQEWLGHSDFSTTANIYAHLDYHSKLSSAEAMLNSLGMTSQHNDLSLPAYEKSPATLEFIVIRN